MSTLRIPVLCFFLILPVCGEGQDNPRITPTVKAVAKALPSVVNIGTERIVSVTASPWGANDPFDRLFRNFYAQQTGKKETSLGSGAIISENGLVVTNSHVVHRATKIIVTTFDGRQFTAKEIAGDTLNDVALLQLIAKPEEKRFRPITFARPDSLILGEPVIAVGNPYGLGSSISRGVLSAVGRKVSYKGNILFSDILQTDAAINPGNSGGPLININGEIIGINTAIYGEADGIGFAIPLKRIESVLAAWMIPEKFRDVSLGIIPAEKIVSNKIVYFIREVFRDSPAWRAGLKTGDVITALNGKRPESLMNISNAIWTLKSGDKIALDIAGKDRIALTVETLKPLDGRVLALNRLGLGLEKFTVKLARALHYPFHGGLLVDEVTGSTINKVRRGEILVRIADIPVYDFSAIGRALQDKHYGDKVDAVFLTVVHNPAGSYIAKKHIELIIK